MSNFHDELLIKHLDERHAAVMERLGEVLTEQRLTTAVVSSHSARIAVLEAADPKGGASKGQVGWISALVAGVISGLAALAK